MGHAVAFDPGFGHELQVRGRCGHGSVSVALLEISGADPAAGDLTGLMVALTHAYTIAAVPAAVRASAHAAACLVHVKHLPIVQRASVAPLGHLERRAHATPQAIERVCCHVRHGIWLVWRKEERGFIFSTHCDDTSAASSPSTNASNRRWHLKVRVCSKAARGQPASASKDTRTVLGFCRKRSIARRQPLPDARMILVSLCFHSNMTVLSGRYMTQSAEPDVTLVALSKRCMRCSIMCKRKGWMSAIGAMN